jgi:hypothetical protein
MLPFSDMVDLFANELARLRGRGLPLFGVAARPFHCLGVIIIFGHENLLVGDGGWLQRLLTGFLPVLRPCFPPLMSPPRVIGRSERRELGTLPPMSSPTASSPSIG